MQILKVEHIKKSFGENNVLKDVSFSLEKGKIYVLMGTNGSGKTTLFNILTGFMTADSGMAELNGENILNKEPHIINRKGIIRTFQDLRLIEDLTVLENVMLAFSGQEGEKWWKTLLPNKKIITEQKQNEAKAKEILKTCFIDDIENSKAGEISYGQQKLVTLACSIANNAEVFLLDEIVAGVNPKYRELLVEVIKTLLKQENTFLIIDHNSDFIEMGPARILFLHAGQITGYETYAD
jgi:ABC-type branched-subunit amino acid transport system ATPase component